MVLSRNTGLVLDSEVDISPVAPLSFVDRSVWRNNGTFGGGAAAPTPVRLPSGLWVLYFDGVNDIITIPDAPCLRFGKVSFSVIIWHNSPAHEGALLTKREAAGTTWPRWKALHSAGDGDYFIMHGQTGRSMSRGTGTNVLNRYTCVGFVIDRPNDTITVYRDGQVDQGVLTKTGGWGGIAEDISNTRPLYLGQVFEFAGNLYQGYESIIKIKQRVMSAGEMNNYFETTRHYFGV